jgi:hypothetical protein
MALRWMGIIKKRYFWEKNWVRTGAREPRCAPPRDAARAGSDDVSTRDAACSDSFARDDWLARLPRLSRVARIPAPLTAPAHVG